MDGADGEEVSFEGDAQGLEGDGSSKVVRRTILKSEGGHTEVCISVYYRHRKFKKIKKRKCNSSDLGDIY